MKILLVEDNLMVAKGIIYSLEQKNYDVVHKVNSMQTKEFLKDNSVDLAIPRYTANPTIDGRFCLTLISPDLSCLVSLVAAH